MTLEQKTILKTSLQEYKKAPENLKETYKWILKDSIKDFPNHKNTLPAKILLRIVKNKR